MFKSIKDFIRRLIKRSGWIIVHDSVWNDILYGLPNDYDASHKDTYNKVKNFTMTSSQRIVALCSAIDYLTINNIEGDIVECGVWRGGSTMAAIDTLINNKSTKRDIYLYDTFEGMPAPGQYDIKIGGHSGVGKTAEELYKNVAPDDFIWCYSSLDEVKQNIESLNYPVDKIHYIKGKVENTIPATIPQKIALLRLDTDFYESTLHELEYLYPLLVSGGVIIIDDYGTWEGARKAVDEYILTNKIQILLNRIDNTGRVGIKF
jgi:O-methyltransferase